MYFLIKMDLLNHYFYFLQGLESIPCKEIGYILRTLGQNPTEDEILEIVCEAGCDWEGDLTKEDFLKVSQAKIQSQVNRLDDVKAAFRFVINIEIIRWISASKLASLLHLA